MGINKKRFFGAEMLKINLIKSLGIISISLLLVMGLCACGAVKSISGHGEHKNLYPDNKPSITDVQWRTTKSTLPAEAAVSEETLDLKASLMNGLVIPNEPQSAGIYSVLVWSNDKWKDIGKLAFDKLLKERSIDLNGLVDTSNRIRIKLVQEGGSAAHIDAISLGGKSSSRRDRYSGFKSNP